MSATETFTYLQALFDGLPGFIDVRTIDAGSDIEVAARRPVQTIEEAERIAATTTDRNVYVGVATRRTGGTAEAEGGKDNLAQVRALWVDFDFDVPDDEAIVRSALETFRLPASMVVRSGGGLHAYWMLDQPLDLIEPDAVAEFENALKGLADVLAGDFRATDASRILRVPGTTNFPNAKKRAKGRVQVPCRLDRLDQDIVYSLDSFDDFALRGAALRAEKVEPAEYDRKDFDGTLPASVASLLDAKGPRGNPRHTKLVERWNGDMTGLRDQSGSGLDQSVANLLALNSVEAADIENALRFRRQEAGDKRKHAGYFALTVGKALAWARTQQEAQQPISDPTNRPTIHLNSRQVREVIGDIADAIVIANEPAQLFRRVGKPVSIVHNDAEVGEAAQVNSDDYLNVISRAADFVRVDTRKGTEHPVTPSRELCQSVFSRLVKTRSLPVLRAVSPTPIIHEDGTLFGAEGYDEQTGIYFAPRPGFRLGHVPYQPTWEEAQEAVEDLLIPFREMPFATHTDSANFLAVLVTAVLRSWFDTVPFCIFEAPIQGSGKTLIAMATRLLVEGATGVGAAPEAMKGNEAEWRKRITSTLLSAPTVCIFDNVVGRLGGPALSALATSPIWSDRLLGKNEAPDLPNTATWVFTSNNATVDTDLFRRCIFVRLDPDDAAPWRRTGFEIPDLLAHIREHRGELLAHVYTLVRFWIAQGRPPAPAGTPKLGGYEKWSRVVPGILGAAGVQGVLGDLDQRAVDMLDEDELEFGMLLEAWFENLPSRRSRVEARAIVVAAGSGAHGDIPLPRPVQECRGAPEASSMARALGRMFLYRKDRWYPRGDGILYRVRPAGGSNKTSKLWTVERRGSAGGGGV